MMLHRISLLFFSALAAREVICASSRVAFSCVFHMLCKSYVARVERKLIFG